MSVHPQTREGVHCNNSHKPHNASLTKINKQKGLFELGRSTPPATYSAFGEVCESAKPAVFNAVTCLVTLRNTQASNMCFVHTRVRCEDDGLACEETCEIAQVFRNRVHQIPNSISTTQSAGHYNRHHRIVMSHLFLSTSCGTITSPFSCLHQ